MHLNTKQAAEASAFTQYLEEKLYPAYQYAWWVDEKNYCDVTRPTYAKALRIPFNFYYPSRYQNSAKEMIDALYGEHTDLREIEKTVSMVASFIYNFAILIIKLLNGNLDLFLKIITRLNCLKNLSRLYVITWLYISDL